MASPSGDRQDKPRRDARFIRTVARLASNPPSSNTIGSHVLATPMWKHGRPEHLRLTREREQRAPCTRPPSAPTHSAAAAIITCGRHLHAVRLTSAFGASSGGSKDRHGRKAECRLAGTNPSSVCHAQTAEEWHLTPTSVDRGANPRAERNKIPHQINHPQG